MTEILFIGDISNPLNKDIIQFLKKEFQIQLFNSNRTEEFDSLLELSNFELVFVSLINMDEDLKKLLYHIKRKHNRTSVLTLGAEYETNPIEDLYHSTLIDNILRPANNGAILGRCKEAIQKRKGMKFDNVKTNIFNKPIQTKSILLVDDSQIVLRNIKGILDHQYDVSMAIDGSQALMILGRKKIDLILLDYDMPVMDGKQVFKLIKANPDLRNIPIIFLTGTDTAEKVLDILSLKPEGYILKPPDTDNFISRIEALIGR